MKIMAIDLGGARTGIAVCDPTEFLASPLTVIHEKDREILLEKIKELAESEKAEELVMGYPRNMNGTIGERAVLYEEFAQRLKDITGLPVVLRDERCTTIAAHSALNVTNTRGKKRKAVIDAVAAVMILEDYLGYRRNQTNQ